ncbi:MAG: AraC family transcriptional regulator ligand-binding domain-containing protein [Gammaproteobacteria bacterium]|nr:AraC family transcriptional regulator ligand-binding domain-containing protein [Gammaproteobacteria bacterium]
MPTSTHTTRLLYLQKLLEVLRELEIDHRPVYEASEITLHDLDHRDGEIGIARYLAAVQAALELDIPADLGFLVGEHTNTLEHGVLGYALLSAANLEECLNRYVRYQHLQGPLLAITLTRQAQWGRLQARPVSIGWQLSREQLAYFTQEWLVGWSQWLQLIGETGGFFSEVSLGYESDGTAAIYEQHLGCRVSFGAACTQALFPADWLSRELDYADASIGALCAVQCEQLLKNLKIPHGIKAELHKQLANSPGSIPGMDEMAAKLFISARTLRRYLANEGTTYQQVVIDFRMAMAEQYLCATALPANEIAALVGYSDSANFYRTFRSYRGVTPSQYRAGVRQ